MRTTFSTSPRAASASVSEVHIVSAAIILSGGASAVTVGASAVLVLHGAALLYGDTDSDSDSDGDIPPPLVVVVRFEER
jgi:hypothetical protein